MYFPKQNIGCNLPLLHFSDFLIKWCYLFHRHFCSEIIWIIKWPRLWLQAFCILERVAFVGTAKFFIRTPPCKTDKHRAYGNTHLNLRSRESQLFPEHALVHETGRYCRKKVNKYNWKSSSYILFYILHFTFYIFIEDLQGKMVQLPVSLQGLGTEVLGGINAGATSTEFTLWYFISFLGAIYSIFRESHAMLVCR